MRMLHKQLNAHWNIRCFPGQRFSNNASNDCRGAWTGEWLVSLAKGGNDGDRRALALGIQLSQGGTHPVNTALADAGKDLKGLLPQTHVGELKSIAGNGWPPIMSPSILSPLITIRQHNTSPADAATVVMRVKPHCICVSCKSAIVSL